MQEALVQSLICEVPTRSGQLKPVCHNWACVLESVFCNKRSHLSEKPRYRQLTATRESLRAAVKTKHNQK